MGALSTVLMGIQSLFLLVSSWEIQKMVHFRYFPNSLLAVVPTSHKEGIGRRSTEVRERYIQWVKFFAVSIFQSTSTFMSQPKATYPVCVGGDGTAASFPFEGPRDVGSRLLHEVPELSSMWSEPRSSNSHLIHQPLFGGLTHTTGAQRALYLIAGVPGIRYSLKVKMWAHCPWPPSPPWDLAVTLKTQSAGTPPCSLILPTYGKKKTQGDKH